MNENMLFHPIRAHPLVTVSIVAGLHVMAAKNAFGLLLMVYWHARPHVSIRVRWVFFQM